MGSSGKDSSVTSFIVRYICYYIVLLYQFLGILRHYVTQHKILLVHLVVIIPEVHEDFCSAVQLPQTWLLRYLSKARE